MQRRSSVLGLSIFLSACGASDPTPTEDSMLARALEPTVTSEEIFRLESRGVIWDLAFMPDGGALFTVREGQLRKLAPGATTSTVVASIATAGGPFAGLFAQGQSGLMGLALDPAFAQNRLLYVVLSHDAGGRKDNRVVRYRLTAQDTLADRTDIVTGISFKAVATENGGPGLHSGGRLRFGPDGFLYLTTGDNHNATIPQNVEALGAKVLRFRSDGSPAPGNPGLGSRNLIWAMGFRNPQGIAFHPTTGAVFISEHGPNQDDEVTKLSVGANGGWNPIGPGGQYNGYTGARMTDRTAIPSAVKPIWVNPDSNGMSASTFLRGASWKAWENRLAVGFLGGKRIVVLGMDETQSRVIDEDNLPNVTDRIRSLVMGSDDKLYATTDSGKIIRYTAR
jgi:aldose sugar dehydrogenase